MEEGELPESEFLNQSFWTISDTNFQGRQLSVRRRLRMMDVMNTLR